MSHDDLWRLSATELQKAYAGHRLTPLQVTEALLERIAARNGELNAFVHVDIEGALKAAEASTMRHRDNRPLGALDGIPLSIKDSLTVGGLPATWGSLLLQDNIPAADELPVARLRAAGAVLLGKTNVPEFTVQGYTSNLLFGATGNPWHPDLTPGGSSGGAVASVAAGLAPLALGTDGGGSTRQPAGYTGLVGLKPGIGRIARHGGFPEIYNDVEVLGLFARSIDDLALLLPALTIPDPRDRHSLAYPGPLDIAATFDLPTSPRILYLPRFNAHPVEAGILAAVDGAVETFRTMGCRIETGPLPFDIEAATAAMAVMMPVGLAMIVDKLGGPARINPALQAMYETGKTLHGSAYLAALNHAVALRAQMAAFFHDWDAILTPSAAAQPWAKDKVYPEVIDGKEAGPRSHAIYTGWVNLAGLPGLALPAALDAKGMPVGFQLIGGFGSEELLLALGRRYEALAPWAGRRPPRFA